MNPPSPPPGPPRSSNAPPPPPGPAPAPKSTKGPKPTKKHAPGAVRGEQWRLGTNGEWHRRTKRGRRSGVRVKELERLEAAWKKQRGEHLSSTEEDTGAGSEADSGNESDPGAFKKTDIFYLEKEGESEEYVSGSKMRVRDDTDSCRDSIPRPMLLVASLEVAGDPTGARKTRVEMVVVASARRSRCRGRGP